MADETNRINSSFSQIVSVYDANTGIIEEISVNNANIGNITSNGNISGDFTGNVTIIDFLDVGNIENLTVDGGNPGQVISTDGAGNLSFTDTTTTLQEVTDAGNVTTNGITVGALTSIGEISGDLVGNVTITSLLDVGNVDNMIIDGGVAGYVLATDGSGNLSWVDTGIESTPWIHFDVTANGNNQTFTNDSLSDYSLAQDIVLYRNGVFQSPDDFDLSGNTITVNIDLDIDDTIDIQTRQVSGGGLPLAGGNANSIQFNNNGALGGDDNLRYVQTETERFGIAPTIELRYVQMLADDDAFRIITANTTGDDDSAKEIYLVGGTANGAGAEGGDIRIETGGGTLDANLEGGGGGELRLQTGTGFLANGDFSPNACGRLSLYSGSSIQILNEDFEEGTNDGEGEGITIASPVDIYVGTNYYDSSPTAGNIYLDTPHSSGSNRGILLGEPGEPNIEKLRPLAYNPWPDDPDEDNTYRVQISVGSTPVSGLYFETLVDCFKWLMDHPVGINGKNNNLNSGAGDSTRYVINLQDQVHVIPQGLRLSGMKASVEFNFGNGGPILRGETNVTDLQFYRCDNIRFAATTDDDAIALDGITIEVGQGTNVLHVRGDMYAGPTPTFGYYNITVFTNSYWWSSDSNVPNLADIRRLFIWAGGYFFIAGEVIFTNQSGITGVGMDVADQSTAWFGGVISVEGSVQLPLLTSDSNGNRLISCINGSNIMIAQLYAIGQVSGTIKDATFVVDPTSKITILALDSNLVSRNTTVTVRLYNAGVPGNAYNTTLNDFYVEGYGGVLVENLARVNDTVTAGAMDTYTLDTDSTPSTDTWTAITGWSNANVSANLNHGDTELVYNNTNGTFTFTPGANNPKTATFNISAKLAIRSSNSAAAGWEDIIQRAAWSIDFLDGSVTRNITTWNRKQNTLLNSNPISAAVGDQSIQVTMVAGQAIRPAIYAVSDQFQTVVTSSNEGDDGNFLQSKLQITRIK